MVAETGPRRTIRGYQLEGAGTRRRPFLAGVGAGHRPHPSIACARRRDGLAHRRGQHLRQRSALWRAALASAFPRDRDPDLQEQRPGAGSGASAAAFAATAEDVRLEWGLIHTVNRAPSLPVIASWRTAPGVSPVIATGMKCSVRPCLSLSIKTCRVA